MNKKINKDFLLFSKNLVKVKDHDPLYFVLKKFCDKYNADLLWAITIYISYYKFTSAIIFLTMIADKPEKFKGVEDLAWLKHNFKPGYGRERRGMGRNIEVQANLINEIYNHSKNHNFQNVENFRHSLSSRVDHVGSWVTYKLSEMLHFFGDEKLIIDDLGISHKPLSSDFGALSGLKFIFGREKDYGRKNQETLDLFESFADDTALLLGMRKSEVETCLCKFGKLGKKDYFVGHDIVEAHLETKETLGSDFENLFQELFEEEFLKQTKTDLKRNKVRYAETGGLLFSGEEKADEIELFNELVELYEEKIDRSIRR
jgi:hypothetical protein